MKKYSICKFWSRFYSPNRSLFFSPRVRAGGLLFEGYPRGNVWNYFRSPGNITFVTTNIVTFVGIVTYDTFVATNEERIFEDRLVAARLSVEREEKERGYDEDDVPTLPPRTEQTTHEDLAKDAQDKEMAKLDSQIELLRQLELKRVELEERRQLDAELKEAQHQLEADTRDPHITYTESNVNAQERHKVMDMSSQRVRMSLFQMVYSFYSYKSALLSKTSPGADSSSGVAAGTDIQPDMDQFYAFWNEKYNTLKLDDTKVEEFKLPNWASYPNLMKSFCFLLYSHPQLRSLSEFQTLYRSVDSYEIKRLLRLWLYDNWFQLKPSSSRRNDFFQELVRDSRADPVLFNKYMSVVVSQENPRALLFFPIGPNNTPSIPVETAIDLLDTSTRTKNTTATVKLISLIKWNCYYDKSLRILLSPPQESNKKLCYRLLSKNKKLSSILDKLSK
ncbi:Uncharacterized protein RNJ44_00407 [Nakaseomyces bracarensis]|uniref:Uncharacterized protein n=1 Tax=Nakaseomyces bracarensis TaxID=273131 RepID=A0ABR4NSI0_9SACH